MIGRWNTIDPKAELDRQWSSYVYGLDNAIRFEDPDGMETCDPCVIDANGVTQTNSRMLTAPDPSLNPFSSANVQGAADAEAIAGGAVEGIGWLGAATGQEYLDPLIAVGAGMSAGGTVVSGTIDLLNGDTKSGILKLGVTAVFGTLSTKIDALAVAGKIETTAGKTILGVTNFAASKIGDKMVEKATTPKLAKNFDKEKSTKFAKDFFKNAEAKKKEEQKKKTKQKDQQ